MYKLQCVAKADKLNVRPQKKRSLISNENPTSISNKGHGIDQANKRQKGVERQPIDVGVEAREEACGVKNLYKRVIRTEKKVYMPLLPLNFKGIEILEDLNNRMEWVLRDYGIS